MDAITPQAIEKYIESNTTAESALLRTLAKETYVKTDLPQMQVGHLEGAFLRLLVRMTRATRILEIGTFTGYSALCMAEGLSTAGKLITLDIDPVNTEIAKKFWKKSSHGKKIKLLIGPALDSLKKLQGSFDMVFIDADKTNYIRYWELCVPKVRRGGILIADNVLWSGRVLHPKDESDRAIVAFNDHVARDKRVESVMLSVRDGMTLAFKR